MKKFLSLLLAAMILCAFVSCEPIKGSAEEKWKHKIITFFEKVQKSTSTETTEATETTGTVPDHTHMDTDLDGYCGICGAYVHPDLSDTFHQDLKGKMFIMDKNSDGQCDVCGYDWYEKMCETGEHVRIRDISDYNSEYWKCAKCGALVPYYRL